MTGWTLTGIESAVGAELDLKLLGREDWTFRRDFLRALRRQERRGEISKKEAEVFRKAIHSGKKNDQGRTYLQQLRFEVQHIAEGLVDDLRIWWDRLVVWLTDNWELVLRVAVSLLLFLI